MLSPVYKDNVAPFSPGLPATERQRASRDRRSLGIDWSAPLPLGVCLLIWFALSGLGWALIYLALHVL
jgi:hypothetical protein